MEPTTITPRTPRNRLEIAREYLGDAVQAVPANTPYTEALEAIVNVLSIVLREMETLMPTDTGFVILTRDQGKRSYEYALPGTGDALCVVSDYLTVSDASDQVHAALVALQESGTYTGVGGTWNLERVNQDGLPRWYELHDAAAGTDPHYLNRVRAEQIRAMKGIEASNE